MLYKAGRSRCQSGDAIAADYAICQQRVGQIAARVEAWIVSHPEHRLAQLMRLQCSRRGIVFIEIEALMRLVDDSIQKRREFRLAEFDRLLFGNKIIE